MSGTLIVLIGIAGGIGAALRYLTEHALPWRLRSRFPWGVAVVNLIGSLGIGVVVGITSIANPESWVTVVGSGLLGGYTTFGSASLETLRLLQSGRARSAILSSFCMLVGCVALAILGLAAGRVGVG